MWNGFALLGRQARFQSFWREMFSLGHTQYTFSTALKQDRRQVRASGFVVKPRRHQHHRLHHAKPALKTPAKQCRVASGDKNSRTLKLRGCRDQCLQIPIGFANGMTEKGNGRCVGSDSPLRFGDHGCALLNCVIEFAPTVVAVDSHTEVVAGRNVGRFGCWADAIAERRLLNWCPLHTCKWFPHHEAELRIESERAIVIRRLNEANSREIPLRRPRHYGLHHLPSRTVVLCGGINRDRSYTRN